MTFCEDDMAPFPLYDLRGAGAEPVPEAGAEDGPRHAGRQAGGERPGKQIVLTK